MTVKPIIGRVGGKSRLAPWIIEHLTRFQWSIYCEPFAGSAAVYFRLINEGVFKGIKRRGYHPRVVLNDADSRITHLFRTCRDYPELLAYAVAMTPYSRQEHREAQDLDAIEDDIEKARRYLVTQWQSVNTDPTAWAVTRQRQFKNGSEPAPKSARGEPEGWDTLPERLLTATGHLKSCYIENDDACNVMTRWATKNTCFYLDPPYIGHEDYYAHNAAQDTADNADLHTRLAETANTVEAACVVVSYYPHDLLDTLYPADRWERHYRDTVASSAGITRQSKTRTRPKRTEMLLVRKGDADVDMLGQAKLF